MPWQAYINLVAALFCVGGASAQLWSIIKLNYPGWLLYLRILFFFLSLAGCALNILIFLSFVP